MLLVSAHRLNATDKGGSSGPIRLGVIGAPSAVSMDWV